MSIEATTAIAAYAMIDAVIVVLGLNCAEARLIIGRYLIKTHGNEAEESSEMDGVYSIIMRGMKLPIIRNPIMIMATIIIFPIDAPLLVSMVIINEKQALHTVLQLTP
jgi:hypothetical protein